MPTTPARDRSIVYTIAFAFVVLGIGFAYGWMHRQQAARLREQAASVYSNPVRVVAGTRYYSVAASFVVTTSGADAEWVKRNRSGLETAAKQVLATQDMRAVLAPHGLLALQSTLRDACNAALRTHKVQQVLVTDFLVGDSSD